ncbi:hypothetical protein SUGI_0142560 [Cryptomeria japonica]|nr:hypothetical protein SUGI_0142560 [Cryptomeria japonica]
MYSSSIRSIMERGDSIHSDGHENDMLDPLLAKDETVVVEAEQDEWKCRHLGELALSSAAIATSFASFSGFCVLSGMGSTLETLCGQAYGAKQYHQLGIHVQRAFFALSCVSLPLAVLWAYMENILIAFGQDPLISSEAGKYARWMIHGAALANSISFWVNVTLLLLYIKISPACKRTWTWTSFTWEALHDIKHFLNLAIPSAFMICLQW